MGFCKPMSEEVPLINTKTISKEELDAQRENAAKVQAVLQKAAGLDIRMLLPLHGHVWRQDLGYILGKYDLWSRWEPEVRGVMIAYASVYGNTENAANILACRLVEQGVKVKMYDVSVTHSSYVVSDAFKYSHLVFAAPTYNGGVFITMDEVLRDIASHGLQNRGFALLENGTWAPMAAKLMRAELEGMKNITVCENVVTIRSAANAAAEAQMDALAAEGMAQKLESGRWALTARPLRAYRAYDIALRNQQQRQDDFKRNIETGAYRLLG